MDLPPYHDVLPTSSAHQDTCSLEPRSTGPWGWMKNRTLLLGSSGKVPKVRGQTRRTERMQKGST